VKVWNASEAQIREAAATAGVTIHSDWAGSGISQVGRALSFRLALGEDRQDDDDCRTASGRKVKAPVRWQRRSTSVFSSERRIAAVCWHGHFAFMSALYALVPDARVKSAIADYRDRDAFYGQAPDTGYLNMGSQMYPVQAREACFCSDYGDDYHASYDLGSALV
jgi:hypothetical protein